MHKPSSRNRLIGSLNRCKRPPHPNPLPKGRGSCRRPLSQPHPLADVATLRCKLAKASLRGEGQNEGGLSEPFNRTSYQTLRLPNLVRCCEGFRMAAHAEAPGKHHGPPSESLRGRNAREAGHQGRRGAMRISAPPSGCGRQSAWWERCKERGGYARLRHGAAVFDGASKLAGAWIASVAMRPGERRRGRPLSGGEGVQQSEWKRLRSCS